MKNKIVDYLIIIMIIPITLLIFSLIRYKDIQKDESIYNKNWYNYNHKTGYYDIFMINEKEINFHNPQNTINTPKTELCSNYTFNKKDKSYNLNCGKKIKIIKTYEDKILLSIDGEQTYYYDNPESSLNAKFKEQYAMSITEYKNSNYYMTDIIKIDENKLKKVYSSNKYSKIVFMGNKCTSIDCVLFLDTLEKWIHAEKDLFFVDSSNYEKQIIEEIEYEFNDIYPTILIVGENKIIDTYKINCDGFNCSKYEDD